MNTFSCGRLLWFLCALMISAFSAGSVHATDARMVYQNLGGSAAVLGLSVPVCSVAEDGTPQVCNLSGPQMNAEDYYTKSDAQTLFSTVANYTSLLTTVNDLSASLSQETTSRQDADALLLSQAVAATTYATQTSLSNEASARQTADALLMPQSGGAFTGTVTAPTPASTDNSKNVATTAFVYNLLSSVDASVTGDVSVSGAQISMPIGDSGVVATLAYSAAGAASMTFYASSGTVSPVDIRRNSIWGASAVETFTLDGGTLTTTGTVADSTIYTASNDSSAYFIRANGTVYFMTVWASGNGQRAFIGLHRMI